MRIVAVFTALLLAACQPAPQSTNLAPISFASSAPMRINVARVNVVEEYQPTFKRPNVEHEFATSPAQGVRAWANQRVQAVGQSGSLEIIIQDASVRETLLPKTEGFRGFVTDDQSERYDASLKVVIKLYDGIDPLSRADANVIATRSQTINEEATIADRERLWHDMTRDMLTAFDKEAEIQMRHHFRNYLR